jgi:hypothetical protein
MAKQPRYEHNHTAAGRRHAEGCRKAMRRVAESRRCPACGRGYALGRTRIPWTGTLLKCRWCPYERLVGSGDGP